MAQSDTATVGTYMQKDVLSSEDVEQLRRLVYGSEKHRKAVKSVLSKLEADSSVRRSAAVSQSRSVERPGGNTPLRSHRRSSAGRPARRWHALAHMNQYRQRDGKVWPRAAGKAC